VPSCREVAREATSLEATRPEGEVLDPDRRADAHAQILAAVSARHHPDPAVRDDFAAAILRRLDTAQLAVLDPGSVARWLTATLTRIASQDPDALQVVVDRPPVGLDGRRPGPMTVDVVCEDRPFLLSTVTDELRRSGFTITRSWHPVVGIERDAHGDLSAIVPARTAHERRAILHLELAGDPDADLDRLSARLRDLIADVVRATTDFEAMHARLADLATELRFADWAGGDDPWAQEVADFIDWLLDENLVILGVREYQTSGDPPVLQVVADSGLGLLRDTSTSRFAEPVPLDRLEPAMRLHLSTPELLIVSRTRRESTVQRRDRMQSILVTREVDGHVHEVRVLGLFTRRALGEAVATTPVLRERLRRILEREDVVPGSHDEAALTSLLQSLPKDELFAVGVDELHRMLVELREAEEQGEVRTLVREDPRSRSVSVVWSCPPSCRSSRASGSPRSTNSVPHPLDTRVRRRDEATLHDFGVRAAGLDPERDGPRVADAILAAWRGHLEVDPLNRLVVVSRPRLVRRLDPARLPPAPAAARHRLHPAYVDTILVGTRTRSTPSSTTSTPASTRTGSPAPRRPRRPEPPCWRSSTSWNGSTTTASCAACSS
jgi:NAD-specific glutamate dehydrogenase